MAGECLAPHCMASLSGPQRLSCSVRIFVCTVLLLGGEHVRAGVQAEGLVGHAHQLVHHADGGDGGVGERKSEEGPAGEAHDLFPFFAKARRSLAEGGAEWWGACVREWVVVCVRECVGG